MGYVYGRTDSYAIGLILLSVTAAMTLVMTLTSSVEPQQREQRPRDHRDRHGQRTDHARAELEVQAKVPLRRVLPP